MIIMPKFEQAVIDGLVDFDEDEFRLCLLNDECFDPNDTSHFGVDVEYYTDIEEYEIDTTGRYHKGGFPFVKGSLRHVSQGKFTAPMVHFADVTISFAGGAVYRVSDGLIAGGIATLNNDRSFQVYNLQNGSFNIYWEIL